jgi:hypothetical protein
MPEGQTNPLTILPVTIHAAEVFEARRFIITPSTPSRI